MPGCGRGGSPVTVYGTHGCERLSDTSRLMSMPLTSGWSLTSFLASETQLPHQKNGGGRSLPERVIGKSETASLMLVTLVGLQRCCHLVAHLCPTLCTLWTAPQQASLSITNSWILKIRSIESDMPSNHLIFCHPLLLPPSIFHQGLFK